MNQLILGDNLEVLKNINSESVDLVYLDPPFFSNRNYEVIWGDTGEVRSFQDRFSGGIEHYIAWLKERVQELHRILKPTGSIFLHCDWHANAYIRVFILDKIFGEQNFRGEIVWKRQTAKKGSQFAKRSFGYSNDTIFWASKSKDYTFKIPKMQLNEEKMQAKFNRIDSDGRLFRTDRITLPKVMMRENLKFEYKGFTPEFGWMMNKTKLEEMDKANRIYWSKEGTPYRKYFADDYEGQEVSNIWDDIFIVSGRETIGYPTQKPEALLQRIIECASNEGDTVLDPFVGGGTTVAVADKLGRGWIGIDQSLQAVKVTQRRIDAQRSILSKNYIANF